MFPHHENELAQSRAASGACSCGHDHGAATASASASNGSGGGGQDEFVRYWLHNGGWAPGGCYAWCLLLRGATSGSVPAASRARDPPSCPLSILSAGFVNVDSEKMSKSLGNFFTIRYCLCRYCLILCWHGSCPMALAAKPLT